MKIKQRSQKRLNQNIRWHMLLILDQIENEGGYSNVLIDAFMTDSEFDSRDKALLTRVVYGVLQHRMTLDFSLDSLLQNKKVDPWVKTLLRLSIYQLCYLDRIPPHAVVNEAVLIAKTNGHAGLGKFVNWVLREFMRQSSSVVEEIEDPVERLSIEYSLPNWLVEYFQSYRTSEGLEAMLGSLNETPKLTARVNLKRMDREKAIARLKEQGIDAEASTLSPAGIILHSPQVLQSSLFQDGLITIQDESSMLVAPVGHIQGDEQILDACCAPGGKATHIASLLTDGHLTALDISADKMNKVAQHMERMNLIDKVNLKVTDALQFHPKKDTFYDIIYLDVPCSGLGIMRRKPEIKYTKKFTDIQALAQIQAQFLNHFAPYVKPGGKLIYSTCTLSYEENEKNVEQFIKAHPQFEIDPIQPTEVPSDLIEQPGWVRIWPDQYHTDGFFICRMKRREA